MSQFLDTVNLHDEEWNRLVSRLDLMAQCHGQVIHRNDGNRRDDPRLAFRRYGIPIIILRDGKPAERLVVCARNLSRGGIGLIHGRFVHPGTSVEVYVPLLDGTWLRTRGQIAFCRYLTNRLHELGCRFDEPIQIERFVEPDTIEDRTIGYTGDELKDRHILILSSGNGAEDVRKRLIDAGAVIYLAETLEDAVASTRMHEIDLVLLDDHLTRGDAGPFVARLRAERYEDAIAVFGINGLTDPDFTARSLSVDLVFGREVDLDVLVEGLVWVLHHPMESLHVD